MAADSIRQGAPVPGGRWARLARLGSLAGGVAGNMLAEGARQFAQGKRPKIHDLLLTPANARRVADQLAQLRGAAMKVGQLLSMDAGELLPPELAGILSRLRADAIPMPMSQVVAALNANWGEGWDRHFQQFSFTPTAAASIGQVHFAQRKDGRHLAIKIQYPGVRQSIDSDVDNVASLLRVSGLLPEMHADLTTANILAMTRLDGVAFDALTYLAQDLHRKVGGLYLLAAKLKAAVNMASIAEEFVLSS